MQRTISSKQTFLMKIVFPLLWIPLFSIGILSVFFNSSMKSDFPKIYVLLIWIIALISIYWFCIRLKKVSVFGDSLYVSNYLKEIKIPLSEIINVTENVWVNIHPVTIHLKNPSEFGNKIVFMPTFRFFGFWSSHPIVSELIELANSKRSDSIFRSQF
jgi:hypothetical protein